MTLPMRANASILLLFVMSFACSVERGAAQDIFDLGADLTAEQADNEEEQVVKRDGAGSGFLAAGETNVVVRSLRTNPPKTAAGLARAIQLMLRVRRWDEVSHWIDEMASKGITEANAEELVQSAGTETFLRLLRPESKISEKQRDVVKKILDLSSASAVSPKKLKSSIQDLQSDVKAVRIQGFRNLQNAGNRGIEAFLGYFLSDQSTAPNATMTEAFSLMGQPAFVAWKAAMGTSDPAAQGRLVLLASRAGESSLVTELCASANDDNISPEVRASLAQLAASKNKAIPSAEQVHKHAIDLMQRALADYQRNRWTDEADAYSVWHLSLDGKALAEVPARVADLHWQDAVNAARAALRTSSKSDIFSALAFVVLLEDSSKSSTDYATYETVFSLLPKEIQDSEEFACLVWDAAFSENLSSAQLLAISNLSRWVSANSVPSPVRDRLVKACSSGHAAVRYQAASALVPFLYVVGAADTNKVLSEVSFEGRSRLDRLYQEMSKLSGNPLCLVVGGSSSLRSQITSLMEKVGYRTTEAASAAQAMSVVKEGVPIESIFIVDHVLEMNLGQLIQRIRANPTTSVCPVAILADSLSISEHSLVKDDDRVIIGYVPPSEVGLSDILRRMRIVNQSPPTDSASRTAWQELASAYLADVKSQFVSKNVPPDFTPWAESAVAQKHLIGIVLDKSRPLPEREQASQIFVQSIRQFGVKLSSETQNAQYDEYNSRGPTESDLRIMLGRVLDAIEAAEGKRTWADVAP